MKNMGFVDRIIRIALALTIGILYLADKISGLAAVILLIFSFIFVLTGLIGICPLYIPFKFKTFFKKQ